MAEDQVGGFPSDLEIVADVTPPENLGMGKFQEKN